MVDFKTALNTTVLVVDDDATQLELRVLVLKMSGFDVLSATNPLDAIAILAQQPPRSVSIAVLDYEMPPVNGCVLADYFKTRDPEMRIVLHSGCVDIPEQEMGKVDCFVPKGDGVERLLTQVCCLIQQGSDKRVSVADEETSAATSGTV